MKIGDLVSWERISNFKTDGSPHTYEKLSGIIIEIYPNSPVPYSKILVGDKFHCILLVNLKVCE